MEAVVAPAGKLPREEVSDVHGHMSGPSDLSGLRRALCSLFRGHDLLTSSPAQRAVYTCVCVRESMKKMPWPGPERAGLQGSIQKVPALGDTRKCHSNKPGARLGKGSRGQPGSGVETVEGRTPHGPGLLRAWEGQGH